MKLMVVKVHHMNEKFLRENMKKETYIITRTTPKFKNSGKSQLKETDVVTRTVYKA